MNVHVICKRKRKTDSGQAAKLPAKTNLLSSRERAFRRIIIPKAKNLCEAVSTDVFRSPPPYSCLFVKLGSVSWSIVWTAINHHRRCSSAWRDADTSPSRTNAGEGTVTQNMAVLFSGAASRNPVSTVRTILFRRWEKKAILFILRGCDDAGLSQAKHEFTDW